MGFNLPINEQTGVKAESFGVCVKAHKLIFKLTENISELVSDLGDDASNSVKIEGAAQVM